MKKKTLSEPEQFTISEARTKAYETFHSIVPYLDDYMKQYIKDYIKDTLSIDFSTDMYNNYAVCRVVLSIDGVEFDRASDTMYFPE